jgi:hypothetical protein
MLNKEKKTPLNAREKTIEGEAETWIGNESFCFKLPPPK